MRAFSLSLICLLSACTTELRTGLTEDTANQMIVVLERNGIGASKARQGGGAEAATFNVEVAPADVAKAIAALDAEHLPHAESAGIQDVFGEASLVPTRTEERARWSGALSGELSRSLERMQGVLSARVHVALADPAPATLDAPPPTPRASVLLRVRADATAPRVQDVQALVAGSVEGMRTDNVAVIIETAQRATAPTSPLVSIGPFRVASGSAATLRAALVASLLVHILCAVAIVVLMRRRARDGES